MQIALIQTVLLHCLSYVNFRAQNIPDDFCNIHGLDATLEDIKCSKLLEGLEFPWVYYQQCFIHSSIMGSHKATEKSGWLSMACTMYNGSFLCLSLFYALCVVFVRQVLRNSKTLAIIFIPCKNNVIFYGSMVLQVVFYCSYLDVKQTKQ